ncbi:hypothetical protein ACVBIL_14985 [Shewanella sp. 125m-7]
MLKLKSRTIRDCISRLEKMDLGAIEQQEVQNVVSRLITGYRAQTPQKSSGLDIFRARICDKPNSVQECSYPSPQYVKALGRANKSDQSVFYGSNYRGVPLFELRGNVGDKVALSHWRTNKPLLLNHIGFTEEIRTKLNCKRDLASIYSFVKNTNNFSELNEMVHEYLGFMFSKPLVSGEEQDYYKLTSCIAELMMKGNIINGLMYPTNQMLGYAENLILKPEYVDSSLDFVNVEYAEIASFDDGQYTLNVLDSASSVVDGELQWTGRPLQWKLGQKETTYSFVFESSGIWVAKDMQGNIIDPT